MSLIGNFIDLGWCGFSGKSPVDEELFPESADAILKNYLLSFSAYILYKEKSNLLFLCMMIQFETRIGNRDSKCVILITILIKGFFCELKCSFFLALKRLKIQCRY